MKRTIDIIKGFFSRNLAWKLFSLCAAIILWFFVMNIINPAEMKTFSVNLSLANEDSLSEKGLALINKQELENIKVDVKIQATRPALDELSKPENRNRIRCYIDLQKVEPSDNDVFPREYAFVVTPSLPADLFLYSYDVVSYTPSSVNANIDELKTEVINLKAEYEGTPKAGYIAKSPTFDIEGVSVIGPASEFDKIADVKVIVDVSDASADISQVVEPIVCDSEGVALKSFIVEPKTVNVSVGVNKQGQVPVNEPNLVGELSDELILKSVDWSPKTIEVEGAAEGLISIESITLPDIDLSTIYNTQTKTFDIRPYLDNTNLQLKANTPTQISVTINVEAKESKDLQISANKLQLVGLSPELRAQVPATVSVSVFGDEALLAEVTADTVQATVDFTGLGEGWHNVELKLVLPEGVELRSSPTVYVMLKTKTDDTDTEMEVASETTTMDNTENTVEQTTKIEEEIEAQSIVE